MNLIHLSIEIVVWNDLHQLWEMVGVPLPAMYLNEKES